MKAITFGKFPDLEYAGKEAINTLCTNLTFTGSKYKKIIISSVVSAEGKSFLSMQIMRTLAGLGKKVALVDADLRRSTLDATYRIQYPTQDRFGITHFLARKCEMNEVIYSTDIRRAFYVPVGYAVSNSLALLNAPRFSNLLDEIASNTDYVLIDAPPVGMIVDGLEIAKSCDGAILVVGYNSVRRRDLLEVSKQIERTGCDIIGTVINNVPINVYKSKNYYGKTYYYGYKAEYVKSSDLMD